MIVRRYRDGDFPEWRRMRDALWPDQTTSDMRQWLMRTDAVTLVAERAGGGLCGFAEAGERSIADGCDTSPVGYLEGWWVDDDARRRGIGRALIRAVELWARERGYRELASDALLYNTLSHAAHEALGFEEVDRVIAYRKAL